MANHADAPKLTDISQWGTANWSTMFQAFSGATGLTTLTANDTPILPTVLNQMFSGATGFNGGNIGTWDTSNVTNMFGMFFEATAFDQDIGNWNTSRVTNINSMFGSASSFNQDISRWDVSKVTSILSGLFSGASSFSQNLGAWYITATPLSADNTITLTAQNDRLREHESVYGFATVSGEANNNNLFRLANTSTGAGANRVTSATLSLIDPLQAGDYTVRINATGSDVLGTNNAVTLTITIAASTTPPPSTPVTANTTDFVTVWTVGAGTFTFPSTGTYTIDWGDDNTETFTNIVNNPTHDYSGTGEYTIRASNTITRFNLANGVSKTKLTDVSQWGTSTWGSSMSGAFYGASNMTMNATDTPNFGSVTDMSLMFADAGTFNQNFNSWNVSSVTNMNAIFFNATSFNGNISNWDVSSVGNMASMFSGANIFNQDISGWDVSSVTNMNSMFFLADKFNQDIRGWDVSNVEIMSNMFNNARNFNQDISGWNVSSITDMSDMFLSAAAFKQNLGRWFVTDSPATDTFTLTKQSSALTGGYALINGNGGSDNTLFDLNGATLSLKTAVDVADLTTKTYSLRIDIINTVFGSDIPNVHEVAITVTSTKVGSTRLYAITVLENTGLSAQAQATVLNAVLPQLLRASTKIVVDNISNRIDQALDAPASASASASFNIDGSSSFQQLINSSVRSAALKNKPDLRQLFNNASFLVPLNLSDEGYGGASNMTLWGSGNYLNFEDNTSGVNSTGKVVGASIGIDTRLEKDLVAGAAVSYTKGDTDYTNAGANGTLISTLTSIHPYVGYQLAEGGRVWGTLGYGQGEVEISKKDNPDDIRKRDTELVSFAFGANRELSSSADWLDRPGTTTLRVKGEVSLSNIEVGEDTTVNAPALSIDANRYRIALEASHKEMLANGASFNPSLELGLRYDDDGGNNSNSSGGGIELAANYRYNNPNGLDVELQVHGLLAHESDYKEWGVSGLVKYQANNSGQGLWLSLTPSFGNTPGNVADRTWDNATITDQINGTTNTLRLNTEIGYGLVGFSGLGLLTPYAGLNITNDIHTYNIGTHWAITPATNLTLTAHRQQSANSIKFLGDFKF